MPPEHPSLPLIDPSRLDIHFQSMRTEYERMLRSVGIQHGWRVLDAGCGTGPFLPLLLELVGEAGEVVAVDRDATMIASVDSQAKLAQRGNVQTLVGDVCHLQAVATQRASFDAVWCANVTQYLDDHSLGRFLGSCRCVLRPGGLLAIKEFEIDALRIEPLPSGLLARLHDARCSAGVTHALALRRTASLGAHLERAGYSRVRATPTEMNRRQPLDPSMRQLMLSLFAFLATEARKVCLDSEDQHA